MNDDKIIDYVRKGMNLIIYGIRLLCATLLVMFLIGFVSANVLPTVSPIGFFESFVLVSTSISLYAVFKYINPISADDI